ncbi:hypothetical protein C8R45DRAFT_1011180 [Mycena sanguinolenta]|nr:hypothetical protein C8R45DRAFT_1011180 [Mycena sanguinolenta]
MVSRPAYWSLDPSGSNPLNHEEASSLGFPSIARRTEVSAISWNETVYSGLRKFDECKGFDPKSQDLAKELGYPLFDISVPAVELDWTLDDYLTSFSEEEYTTEDELESDSDSDLTSSRIAVLTMDDEDSLDEISSREDDGSDCHPDKTKDEIESNPRSNIQEFAIQDEGSLQEFASRGAFVGQRYSVGELAELVKFGLIIALGLVGLYEYAPACF